MNFDEFDNLSFEMGDQPTPAEVPEAIQTPMEWIAPTSVDHRQVGPPPIFHYTLDCAAFDSFGMSALYSNKCCEHDCHEGQHRIIVYPPKGTPDKARDRELGINAAVCCGRYALAMSMSREWWVRKMLELDGVTDVNKVNERLYEALSWHPAYEARRNNRTPAKVGQKKVEQTCLMCGKKTTNSEGICNKCMP